MHTLSVKITAHTDSPMERPSNSAGSTLLSEPRSSINSLSNEIILNIIEHLPLQADAFRLRSEESDKLLLHVMLCSKRLHRLAEPSLYQTFTERGPNSHNPSSLLQFLKRILARPDLAARVRCYGGIARIYIDHKDVNVAFKEQD